MPIMANIKITINNNAWRSGTFFKNLLIYITIIDNSEPIKTGNIKIKISGIKIHKNIHKEQNPLVTSNNTQESVSGIKKFRLFLSSYR